MVKAKKLFTVSFAITVFIRALSLHEIRRYIPYTEIYIAYMAFWGLMMLSKGNGKVLSLRANGMKVIVMLTLYYIIWGLTTTPAAWDDALLYMYRSLLMMVFIAVSCFWIRKLDCLEDVIIATFAALSTLIWVVFLFYFRQIDLIRTLGTYWALEGEMRTRTNYGFLSNIAAEHSMSVILLSLYLLKKDLPRNKRILIWLNNLLMVFVIISSNSRGTTLALIFMTVVCFCISHIKRKYVKMIVRAAVTLVFLIFSVLILQIVIGKLDITELLTIANRVHFLDNIEILKASGRWLFGIGNISGDYYADQHMLYGLTSNYMEVAYIAFFVGNGVIGCIWLLRIIFLLLDGVLNSIKTLNETLGRWMLLVFIYMLFLSLFEGYIFSFMYITSTVYLILIISCINLSYYNANKVNYYAERENQTKCVSPSYFSRCEKDIG